MVDGLHGQMDHGADAREAAYPAACTFDPELAVALDFRRHVFTYFRNRPGASALRRRLNDLRTSADILAAVADCFPDARETD